MQDNNSHKKTNSDIKKKQNSFFEIDRFIPRIFRNWLLYVCSFIIAIFFTIYLNNWHLDRVYSAESNFHVSSNSSGNSNLGSNSINFIWGGSSNKIDVLSNVVKSRTHSLDVAKTTAAYVAYLEEGTIKKSNSYRLDSPFHVEIDTTHNQFLSVEIQVKMINSKSYQLIPITSLNSNQIYNYGSDSIIKKNQEIKLPQKANFGEWIESESYRFKIVEGTRDFAEGSKYSFKLTTLDAATNRVRNGIEIGPVSKMSSILRISKNSSTQNEAIDIVNTSVRILRKKELYEKNQIAYNTIKYIRQQMGIVKEKVDSASSDYQNLQKRERIYDIGGEKGNVLSNILNLEREKVTYQERISALNSVSNNVRQVGTQGMMALEIAGLNEGNFTGEVSNLKNLEEKRKELVLLYKPSAREVQELDQQIGDSKTRIEKAISASRNKINQELGDINRKLAQYEGEAYNMPEKEKEFLDASRGYVINDALYGELLNKLNQAELTVASNISDITVIDYAKNLNQSPVAPDTRFNYLVAIIVALIIPTLYLIAREIFDTKIKGIPDIVRRSSIPFIGAIGNNTESSNPLVVLERPKSGISEAFRAIRSNLTFLYKRGNHSNNKTIIITSSVGGEGKTFMSMNISSVLALSGKKTLLIGTDMRKPKIFDEFGLDNKKGLSNYLSGNANLQDVIQKTRLDSLDVITGGPIPPNPSELLLQDTMGNMLRELKEKYDFVILDTPPVALVSDAYDLMNYADATLYIARFDYTYRGLLKNISDKYDEGEVSNIGIVLNDFQTKGSYGYGYGYGYGYFEEDANYDPSIVGKIKRLIDIRKYFKK